ncbi:MAG TPA: DUF6382 domain-containing protein [Negativicutes bacterium]|nr:DUF6382 domain-containing protein [Negativicutes bacterium]
MLYNNNGQKFEYSFSSDAAYSYLVVETGKENTLQKHQVEIICRNPNPLLVPFYTRRENEDTSIFYNITSKVSLAQYLERKSPGREELLDLIRNIIKGLMLHGNYLLELSGFVLDTGFIFINPATAEVSLVYIPVSGSRNSTEAFKGFIRDLLVNHSEIDESTRDNYIQRLLGYLKSEAFSLQDFDRLVAELRYNKAAVSEAAAAQEDNYTVKAGEMAIIEEHEISQQISSGEKSIARLLLFQLLILLPVLIACLLLVSKGMGDLVTIAGILIIAAALDVFLTERFFGRFQKKVTSFKSDRTIESNNRPLTPVIPSDGIAAGAMQPDMVKACDTVMISETPKSAFPYLERADGKRYERIPIDKNRFVIGRLEGMVDYMIPDSTIGKLHAKIVCRDEGCFMKDLNSKNGTYINGSRLTCNEEYEVRNNYRIRFSSYEYIFRQ